LTPSLARHSVRFCRIFAPLYGLAPAEQSERGVRSASSDGRFLASQSLLKLPDVKLAPGSIRMQQKETDQADHKVPNAVRGSPKITEPLCTEVSESAQDGESVMAGVAVAQLLPPDVEIEAKWWCA